MNSEPPRASFAWLRLAWWHEHDARLKQRLAKLGRNKREWSHRERTHAIMLLCHAIGWPLLATPLLTEALYPWLPQPDAFLFYHWGATSLGGALLARVKLMDIDRGLFGGPPTPGAA